VFGNVKSKKNDKVLCLGVTYKENVDDLRESAAIKIINKLKQHIKNIYIYDPLNKSLNNISEKKLKNYKFDLIVFLVNHNNFKKLNFKLTRILDYRY
jgi:UDP-N-acetyl-D-mannosaminuronate dehydrogenase